MRKRILSFLIITGILIGSISANAADYMVSAAVSAVDIEAFDGPVGGVETYTFQQVEWVDEESGNRKGSSDDSLTVQYRKLNSAIGQSSEGAGTYGYNTLNEQRKSAYFDLKQAVDAYIAAHANEDITSEMPIRVTCQSANANSPLTLEDAFYIVTAFLYDNPQYYFLSNSTNYALSNGQLQITMQVDDYYKPSAKRQEADSCIKSTGDAWVDELNEILQNNTDPKLNSQYLAAVRAHDLIISRINYAYDGNGQPESSKWAHSIAGVFTEQGVVCEGYARAYQYLLNRIGLDNVYVVGTADTGRDRGGHAWNYIHIDNKWYPVDATWDDIGKDDTDDVYYCYFAIPGDEFTKDHHADNAGKNGMYTLPTLDDSNDYTYYKYFKGYGNDEGTLDETAALALYNAAASAKPSFKNYLYFSVKDTASISAMLGALHEQSVPARSNSYFGYVFKIQNIVIKNPTKTLKLSHETLELELNKSAEITATIDDGSDDKIVFSVEDSKYCTVTTKGNKAVIVGKRNGVTTLTATNIGKTVSATCEITVGTGIPEPEGISHTGKGGDIWQNGTNEYKKIQLDTVLSASTWEDSKGKTKSGKLVWIASDKEISISFDKTKHTLKTKTKPTVGTVNNNGVVTAKKAGTLYVYCCDTGSFQVEQFAIQVLAAPSKLLLGYSANIKDTKEVAKKEAIPVGSTAKIYITGNTKTGFADESSEYTATLAKSELEAYFSVSKVEKDENGAYFTVTALDFDRTKNKAVSGKVNIVCTQSNKKASITVIAYNPVTGVTVTEATGKKKDIVLAEKGDSYTFNLQLQTRIKGVSDTTDKVKMYISLDGEDIGENNKIIKGGKTDIKLKYDSKSSSFELIMGKKTKKPAVVTIAAYSPQEKEYSFFKYILEVDSEGNVSFLN